jgi:hypothetical protein
LRNDEAKASPQSSSTKKHSGGQQAAAGSDYATAIHRKATTNSALSLLAEW